MLEFVHPWFFLFAVIPIMVRWLSRPYREKQPSVQVPFFEVLVEVTGASPHTGAVVQQKMRIQKILLIIGWSLLVVAMTRPEFVGAPIVRQKSARDIMIAVDISGSMDTQDFAAGDHRKITRFEGVIQVLEDFVNARRHDRLGLIVFGTSPYLQSPFTADHQTFLSLFHEIRVGMAGPKTNFGDAIGLAIRLFEKSETQNRVLIVLTDGNDTGSKVPPVEAAKIARAKGVRIYCLAVGDLSSAGQEQIDTETLEKMADITKGGFFEAQNHRLLEKAYRDILAFEPEKYETIVFSPRASLHHYFLGAVMVLYTLFFTAMFVASRLRRTRTSNDV